MVCLEEWEYIFRCLFLFLTSSNNNNLPLSPAGNHMNVFPKPIESLLSGLDLGERDRYRLLLECDNLCVAALTASSGQDSVFNGLLASSEASKLVVHINVHQIERLSGSIFKYAGGDPRLSSPACRTYYSIDNEIRLSDVLTKNTNISFDCF